jgi:protein-S-isoprenylcysteine O-methyltransferase Ste14
MTPLVLVSYLVALVATFAGYGRANNEYSGTKVPTGQLGPFTRLSDWYLRLSTIVVALSSLVSDHAGLLQFHHSVPLTAFGASLLLCGAIMLVWALRSLGENYSPCFDAYTPTTLCLSGPYALIRHPVYSANLLQIAGVALSSRSLWLVVNLLIYSWLYFVTALNEERILSRDLPGYADYVRRSFMFCPHPRVRKR